MTPKLPSHMEKHLDVHGSVTVGSRGQVVIPSKLRKKMNIKEGDSLIVFTKHDKIIGMMPEENATQMIRMYEKHIEGLRKKFKSS